MKTKMVAVVLVGALGVATAGCEATVEPAPAAQPVGYAEVTAAPVDIDTYPSVVYEGHPTYFYGDRWWYRDGNNWSYYHSEPAELHRQREYVQRAPRRAPAAHVEERGREEAPPAERERVR